MTNPNHPWSRDPVAQAAVRAAEDAAAVPAIQHRDLPDIVADLRERVARMEAAVTPKSVSGSIAESLENKGDTMPADGLRTERVTIEVTHAHEISAECWDWSRDLAPGESVRVFVDTYLVDLAEAVMERDAALRERDAAKEECERLQANMEGHSRMDIEREIAVEEAWERCGLAPHWPDDEPGTSHRYAKSMEAEIVRLRACVAELEAAAANAGGEKQQPVGYGVRTEWGQFRAGLYTSQRAPANLERGDEVVPLYAAPQPPRGWLTEEERAAVEEAMVDYASNVGDSDCERIERVLRALLARETPPRVKVPPMNAPWVDFLHERDGKWRDAIRAAGGEVEG